MCAGVGDGGARRPGTLISVSREGCVPALPGFSFVPESAV